MRGQLRTRHGPSPGPAEVQSAFTSLPEGKSYEDKFGMVILDDTRRLVGHLELVRDYPIAQEWWFAVLLLAPWARRRGLGSEIHEVALAWVRAQGGRAMALSVIEENSRALKFWRRLGYEEVDRIGSSRLGSKEHTLIIFRRET